MEIHERNVKLADERGRLVNVERMVIERFTEKRRTES
jgi:hypothetical protein